MDVIDDQMQALDRARRRVDPPTPMAMAMEQADPGGVSCTTRNVSPWLKSRSTLKPAWSASKVFARSASDTGTGTSSSLKRPAHRPFWVWPGPARDLPVCCHAAAR
jgi:hypothetical protein